MGGEHIGRCERKLGTRKGKPFVENTPKEPIVGRGAKDGVHVAAVMFKQRNCKRLGKGVSRIAAAMRERMIRTLIRTHRVWCKEKSVGVVM